MSATLNTLIWRCCRHQCYFFWTNCMQQSTMETDNTLERLCDAQLNVL